MRDATQRLLLTMLVVLMPAIGLADQRSGAKPAAEETLLIDGSKNPELVPQWSVWEFSFDLFGAKKLLPNVLLHQLSGDEPAIILEATAEHLQREAEHHDDVRRLNDRWTKAAAPALDERLRQIKLEYRRGILQTRDRLLAALSPGGAAALAQFVEGTKSGMKIAVRKADLALFLQPE